MSKLFWGGLRAGWVRGPEMLIERLARFKAISDLGGPVLSQTVAAQMLPEIERVRGARQREVERKRASLVSLLREELPQWSWQQPAGGLLLWVRLPKGNASEYAQVALRHGVAIVPGSVNSPTSGFSQYVRLPFIEEPQTLREGITRLARAWREYEAAARERRLDPGVIV
jgi:DNA-binding transcriptional MocR family regulator